MFSSYEYNTKLDQGIKMIIWIMGLSGSGKTTLASRLKSVLKNSIFIDGDEFREVFENFGYDKASRIQIAKQKAALAKLLSKQGYIAICTAISLFEENYIFNRSLGEKYLEIYLKCDFDELVRRDQKGLYSSSIKNNLKNVVGVDIKYDEPNADLTLDSSDFASLESNLNAVLHKLEFIKKDLF